MSIKNYRRSYSRGRTNREETRQHRTADYLSANALLRHLDPLGQEGRRQALPFTPDRRLIGGGITLERARPRQPSTKERELVPGIKCCRKRLMWTRARTKQMWQFTIYPITHQLRSSEIDGRERAVQGSQLQSKLWLNSRALPPS